MRRAAPAAALLFALVSPCLAVAAPRTPSVPMPAPLPPLREQDQTRQGWLKLRLERVLPSLLRKYGVDMWIVACREYNEDPAFFSLVSPRVMAARRTTILVFHDRGPDQGVDRLALGGGSSGGLYQVYRDPQLEGRELWGQGQWALLRKLLDERRPSRIALNISQTHAFADGVSVGLWEQLAAALGPWTEHVVRAEGLAVDYVAVRLPEMLPSYRHMMGIVHALIARAFSNEVITPGRTTTQDVEWWLRQRVNDMGLGEWFPPSVSVQRPAMGPDSFTATADRGPVVIERGDHLHTDFGIQAMGLATDTQHVGYVLKPGEVEAPEGLRRALENSNRLQDIVMARAKPGRTGNEVLADSLAAMREAGIEGTVYTHPIGDHGHGAGPLIGLWDRQEGVPGRGDVRLLPSTWFSIELQATTPVPEWGGQRVRSAQEEDAVLDEAGAISWVLSRQTRYHLVR